MSYDNDFDQNEQTPSDLRKLVDKANKANADKDQRIAELESKLNGVLLTNIFTEKKVPAALQRLMKAEKVDASPESVDKWLTDNGSDFGWNPQAASTETPEGQQVVPQEAPARQSVLDEDDIAGQQRMQQLAADGSSPHTLSDQAEQAVQAASSVLTGGRDDFDKLMQAFREQGIAVESAFG